MEFSISYTDDRFELSLSGLADVVEYDSLLNALTTHNKWQPGSHVLSDETTMETSHLTSMDIAKVADICGKYRGVIGEARFAIIARDDLVFGLNRMWEIHVESQWEARVQVFRTSAEALQWLSA